MPPFGNTASVRRPWRRRQPRAGGPSSRRVDASARVVARTRRPAQDDSAGGTFGPARTYDGRVAAGGHAPDDAPVSAHSRWMTPPRDARERLRRLLVSDAPGRLPVRVPSPAIAAVTLAAYVLVSDVSGSDHARFDLLSIPIFVAAILLPARTAILVGVAAVTFALVPLLDGGSGSGFEGSHLVEVLVIVGAAVFMRTSLASRVALETERAEQDARSAERMRTVLGIAERMSRTFDRSEIFQTIAAELTRAMQTDVTTIRLLRDDVLVPVAWQGIPDDAAARLPVVRRGEGWFGHMLATGRPWVRDDAGRQPQSGSAAERHGGLVAPASDLVVPLLHHGDVIGTLSTETVDPRRWSPDDVDFMTAVATHASIAIHNAELFEQTEARAAQLAVLQAASARMNRQNTLQSVGRAIVEETDGLLEYHNARVYLLEGEELVPIAFQGTVGEYEKVDLDLLRTKIGVGFTGWVGLHGEPLLVDDANADPRGATIPGTDDVDESMLVVPIRYDEGVIGVITLSKLGLRQFDDEDLRLLSILADQAATALESARLLARSQQLASELRRLVDMSGELAHSLDPRQVAVTIARHLAQVMSVDACTISYWDRAGDRIETLGQFPGQGDGTAPASFDLAGYPETRRVLLEQAAVVVDVDDAAADPAEVALLRADGNATLAMLPLVANGATIGLVELLARRRVAHDAPHLELARTMANEAAMALENARLYAAARALADRDQLTGFFNHRYLHERLGEEIVRAQRSRRPLALLMIDLDDFKLVNDTFGHLFGDRVLAWVGELIRSTLRASDVPARYGGDEFAVVLPEADAAAATRAAERILEACRITAFQGESRGPVPIALSIGVAAFPDDGRSAPELIASADRALYRVKHAGGAGLEPADRPAIPGAEEAVGGTGRAAATSARLRRAG